jgi:hypothetical protein
MRTHSRKRMQFSCEEDPNVPSVLFLYISIPYIFYVVLSHKECAGFQLGLSIF